MDPEKKGGSLPVGKPLLDALDRVGFGGLVLDTSGRVVIWNDTAAILVMERAGHCGPAPDAERMREATKALLRSTESKRFRMHNESWVLVPNDSFADRGLVLHAMPIAPAAMTGAHTVLILINLDDTPRPNPEVLRNLFELTPAEAKLASSLVAGRSLEEIAAEAGLQLATIRKQLASVFAKTRTHRQGELVALLGRLSILP